MLSESELDYDVDGDDHDDNDDDYDEGDDLALMERIVKQNRN